MTKQPRPLESNGSHLRLLCWGTLLPPALTGDPWVTSRKRILACERGWCKFWWKRTACVTNRATCERGGEGLRVPALCHMVPRSIAPWFQLAVPVTLHVRPNSHSVCLSWPPCELKHAGCLGHCVIWGPFWFSRLNSAQKWGEKKTDKYLQRENILFST